MTTLLLAKHDNHVLNDATSKSLTSALAIGSPVHVLVAGSGCRSLAEAAAKLDGIEKVLLADDPSYEHRLAEPLAALVISVADPYEHLVSVTRDMSGFGSTRSVRFLPEGSHAAGGQNGPDHRCDWVASDEGVELHRGGGAVGNERAAFSPAARRL